MSSIDPSAIFLQMFERCATTRCDQDLKIECASAASLVELVHRDWRAEYLSHPALPGFDAFASRQDPSPCGRYVAVRRALSTGNYGEAMAQLRAHDDDKISRTTCSPLLALEWARLQWFVDEFERALGTLSTIGREPLPFVHLRARDLVASCAIELFCLKSIGFPLAAGPTLPVPDVGAFEHVAAELGRVALESRSLGDVEAAGWAALNAELADALFRGRLDESTVQRLVEATPKNGHPHALRRFGLVFAHLDMGAAAVGCLRESHRLAEGLYPMNLIGLKSALNLAWVTHQTTRDTGRRELASNVLRAVICRFVVSHAALSQTALATAVNSVSQHCLMEPSDAAVRAPSEREIMRMLQRMAPEVMEKLLARSLLEHVIGPVDVLPQNYEWLDLVAHGTIGGQELTYGIQVKSGNTSLLMKDIPAPHVLAPHRGFIAIAAKRIGPIAATHLKKLSEQDVIVHDWTGENLARLVRQHPKVVALLYRESLDLDQTAPRGKR